MPKFVDHIELNGLELRAAKIHPLVADPTGLGAADEGRVIYNTASDQLKVWNGTAWVAIGADANTLGGQPGSYYLARANHTGTQAPATIAFATTARLLGRATAGAGTGEEVSVQNGLQFSGAALQLAFDSTAPPSLTPDIAGAAGASTVPARRDHIHNVPADVAGASAVGDTAAEGTAASFARADHRHSREAFGAAAAEQTFGSAPTNGVATTLARSDHKHGNPDHDGNAHIGISRSVLANPTADVPWGGFKITGLGDPTSAQDAATKAYVDGVAQGLDIKDSVYVATTGNINLASPGTTIDGVTVPTGVRVLVKDQTTASQNGIYIFNGSASAMTRAPDADAAADITPGTFVFVERGTVNDNTGWVVTTDAVTVGTTAIEWAQFTGAGQINAGAGLTKAGNTIDVVGAANSIDVDPDFIRVSLTYPGQTSITTLGTIATGTWNATTIAANRGGTGHAAYAVGDLLFASSASALSRLADVATGNALISGGVGVAPSWGKIGLTTHVSGTLPAANGGTGLATYAAGDIIYATAATTLARLAAAADGNVLQSTAGTAPAWGKVGLTTHVTGTLPVANGGTGATAAAAARTNLGATGKFTSGIGNGTSTTITVNPGLGTDTLIVSVYETATGAEVFPTVAVASSTSVSITFAVAPTLNQYTVVIVG